MILALFLMLFDLEDLLQLGDLLFDRLDFSIAFGFDETLTSTHEWQHVSVGTNKASSKLSWFAKGLVIQGLQEDIQFLSLPLKQPFKF